MLLWLLPPPPLPFVVPIANQKRSRNLLLLSSPSSSCWLLLLTLMMPVLLVALPHHRMQLKQCGLPSNINELPDFAQDEIRAVWKDYVPGKKCDKELLITEDILAVLAMFDKELEKQGQQQQQLVSGGSSGGGGGGTKQTKPAAEDGISANANRHGTALMAPTTTTNFEPTTTPVDFPSVATLQPAAFGNEDRQQQQHQRSSLAASAGQQQQQHQHHQLLLPTLSGSGSTAFPSFGLQHVLPSPESDVQFLHHIPSKSSSAAQQQQLLVANNPSAASAFASQQQQQAAPIHVRPSPVAEGRRLQLTNSLEQPRRPTRQKIVSEYDDEAADAGGEGHGNGNNSENQQQQQRRQQATQQQFEQVNQLAFLKGVSPTVVEVFRQVLEDPEIPSERRRMEEIHVLAVSYLNARQLAKFNAWSTERRKKIHSRPHHPAPAAAQQYRQQSVQ